MALAKTTSPSPDPAVSSALRTLATERDGLSTLMDAIGNGLGAFVMRELTIRNIDQIKRYVFLKNGAMYSILCLGAIMVLHSFGVPVPSFVSPVITFSVVGYFLYKSIKFARYMDLRHGQ